MSTKINFELGRWYKDTLTGFEGYATQKTIWLNGCVRVRIEPELNDEGLMVDGETFDVQQLVLDVSYPACELKDTNPVLSLKMETRDMLTKIEGTIIALSTDISGTTRAAIQPYGLKKNGSPKEAVWFEENRLEVMNDVKEVEIKRPTGGPQRFNPPSNNIIKSRERE